MTHGATHYKSHALNRVNFLADLATAQKGDPVVYHRGSLMFDRLRGPNFQNVHAIATAAWEAFMAGRCTLVQHRISPLEFDYIAIKKDKAIPGVVACELALDKVKPCLSALNTQTLRPTRC